MPHFLTDFFGHLADFDILTDRSNDVERICISEHRNNTCSTVDSNFRFAHFLPDSHRRKRFSSWIPQFLTTFSDDWFFYSPSLWFNKSDKEFECFRSIIRHHGSAKLHSSDWLQKTMLKAKYANRDNFSKLPFRNVFKNSLLRHTPCKPNILIVDRKRTSGRDISNIEDVKHVVRTTILNHSINTDTSSDGNSNSVQSKLRAYVSTFYMEDLSFHKQVEYIRNTNMIIATHGAGLTNLIFAWKGTLVYEIYPFLYYPPNFFHLSQMFGLNYSSTIANPDLETYSNCIEAFSIKRKNINFRKLAFPHWNSALNYWKQGLDKHVNYLLSDPKHAEYRLSMSKYPDLPGVHRSCLRAQHMTVDITEFRKEMQAAVTKLCRDGAY